MKKPKYHSYKDRIVFNSIYSILFAIIAIVIIVFSSATKTTLTLFYQETSNLDYKVFLKENKFFNEPYLGKDLQYVASLIDYIEVFFNYNYQMNENVDYTYKYYIESDVVVFDKDNTEKVLFQRKSNLTDEKTIDLTNKLVFQINENIKINYEDYNELVRSFNDNYNLNAESNLKLRLFVEVISKHDKFSKPIETKNVMEMSIPLTRKTINVDMNYNQINDSDIFTEASTTEPINYILLGVGSAVGAISIIFLIRLLSLLRKTRKKINVYEKTIAKLKKEYDRAIVNIKKTIDITDDMHVIDVIQFEELLDASDRLELPILFMEIHKGQKAWFIVRNGNDIYRLVVKSVDL